jgi:hypothetical protein
MTMTGWFDPAEYRRGLLFRIVLFAFIGLGWDVLMTLLQQTVSGKLGTNAICPASAWMYFIYSGIPLVFYPVVGALKRLRFPYPARLIVLLGIFYLIEYGYGSLLRSLGITAWDYNWFLHPRWTSQGLITWHPAFIAAWLAFVAVMEWLDTAVRNSYPAIREQLAAHWRSI